jgi:hypothetical protein
VREGEPDLDREREHDREREREQDLERDLEREQVPVAHFSHEFTLQLLD